MDFQRADELRTRLDDLLENMRHIDAMCNGALGETASSIEEEEFRKTIPQRDMYRQYKLKYVGIFGELVEEIKDTLSFEQLMEDYFYLAAEYALMGEIDKMNIFVGKVDWKRWNISQCKNPDILQVYRDLTIRARELQSLEIP